MNGGEEAQISPPIGGDDAAEKLAAISQPSAAPVIDVEHLIGVAVERIIAGLKPETAIAANPPPPDHPSAPPLPTPNKVFAPSPEHQAPVEQEKPTTAVVIPLPVLPALLSAHDDPLVYGPVEEERLSQSDDDDQPSAQNIAPLTLDPVFRSDPQPLFAENLADTSAPSVQPPPIPAAQSSFARLEPAAPPIQTDAIGGYFSGPWTLRRGLRLAVLAVAAYFATVLVLIVAYRFINPPTTTLIAYQWMTGTKIEQQWVPIENISSNLLRAVVVSEDWGFCDHYGVDIEALERALEQAGEGKIARGASTISMQVIKNLFLSQSKSYLRKAVEIPLTVVAETVWPKSRMLEIYLNIAEWGPGVFGAEAAARHHFKKPASRLSERESALLAAALPNPILRDAGDPGTRTARKASVIQSRMRAAGPVANCAMTGRQRSSDAGANPEHKAPSGWQTAAKKRAGADPGL